MLIVLGSKVVDTVTGFTGIATGRCTFLHGPPRVQVTALAENGKPADCWFNEDQLELAPENTERPVTDSEKEG
jgi:hypothetical protein